MQNFPEKQNEERKSLQAEGVAPSTIKNLKFLFCTWNERYADEVERLDLLAWLLFLFN